jgi:flagellar hook-associated protein 2
MGTTSNLSGVLSSINGAFSGKTTGIDVASVVSQLMALQRQPETQMQQQQTGIQNQVTALSAISSALSNLSSSVNNLKDSFGALSQKSVTSSQPAMVTASAAYSAPTGNHTITVTHLATVSSSYSATEFGSSDSLAGKTIKVTYGDPQTSTKADSIQIPSDATSLQQVVNFINSSNNNFSVSASLLTDSGGTRLVLNSKSGGATGNLTLSGDVAFTAGTAGVDAQLSVDGVPVVSATNTITGALPGVTLTLTSAEAATPVQINVAADTTEAASAISSFIDAYNAVLKDINAQYIADSSGNEGALASDSALRVVQSQLLDAVSFSANGLGQYVNLQSLGIEMQNDGTLQLNTSVMSDTLTNHYSEFQNFFQSISTQGFGQSVGNTLLHLTDVTEGPLQVDINSLKATNSDLTNQINAFEDRMTNVQQQLLKQYSNINALLRQYPQQIQEITAQLGSLPSGSSK